VTLLLGTLTSGCYLASLGAGQARLLHARRPIDEVLADPATPAETRAKLDLVAPVRDFARSLGLDVGGQYTTYAAWPGDRIVTGVVATRPGEIEPVTSWFPLVGRVPYRGYFDLDDAEHRAAVLRGDGLDVCLFAVPAYSSLGWFDDPVTAPMLRDDEVGLVELLLHELLHRTVFVPGDAALAEGLATWVGQQGAIAYFAARDGAAADTVARARARAADARALSRTVARLRDEIAALYDGEPPGPMRAAARAALEADARRTLAALPLDAGGATARAGQVRLNDACLAVSATYGDDLEALDAAAARLGGLAPLIAAARRAASAPDPRAVLLGPAPEPAVPAALGVPPDAEAGSQDRLSRRR